MPPIIAYLLFDDQPARNTPGKVSEVIASRKRMPMLRFTAYPVGEKGMTL